MFTFLPSVLLALAIILLLSHVYRHYTVASLNVVTDCLRKTIARLSGYGVAVNGQRLSFFKEGGGFVKYKDVLEAARRVVIGLQLLVVFVTLVANALF